MTDADDPWDGNLDPEEWVCRYCSCVRKEGEEVRCNDATGNLCEPEIDE
jgi:hypothetical protein